MGEGYFGKYMPLDRLRIFVGKVVVYFRLHLRCVGVAVAPQQLSIFIVIDTSLIL